MYPFGLVAIIIVVMYLLSSIKILAEDERGVIIRLGRRMPYPKGPGIILLFGPVDRMVRVRFGAVGVAHTPLAPEGEVSLCDELWDATATALVGAGEEVVVRGMDGLKLRVEPVAASCHAKATARR